MKIYLPQIIGTIISLILILITIFLIYKRELKSEFGLFWLFLGLFLFIISIWNDFLIFITKLFGFQIPATTLFFFGIFFAIFLHFIYSIRLSKILNNLTILARKLALLVNEFDEFKKRNK